MPRKPNPNNTVPINVSASAEVAAYLDELAERGIHGKTRSEVARFLISIEIERLIREGILKPRKSKR